MVILLGAHFVELCPNEVLYRKYSELDRVGVVWFLLEKCELLWVLAFQVVSDV